MAYDYSHEFLQRNADLVAQLEELYRSRNIGSLAYDDAGALTLGRNLINNVLAAKALYDPDWKPIRAGIRTWARYGDGLDGMPNDEQWHLFVGVPSPGVRLPGMKRRVGRTVHGDQFQAIRGSPPGERVLMMDTAKYAAGVEEQGILRYPNDILSQDELLKFIAWVLDKHANPLIEGVRVEVRNAAKALPTFNATFGENWSVEVLGETTIQLMRLQNAG